MKNILLSGSEPSISVGLVEQVDRISFEIIGESRLHERSFRAGRYTALADGNGVIVLDEHGGRVAHGCRLHFVAMPEKDFSFSLYQVPIGKDFHWQRLRDQQFQGELLFLADEQGQFTVINNILLEQYLEAVICSEMSAASPREFLKAHCVISRSWLLAQRRLKKKDAAAYPVADDWTDAAVHRRFDVCADDHCQRYHGRAHVNAAVREALEATRGNVLVYEDEICDTRFSKCCGGISERFATAWQDRDVGYLQPVSDTAADMPAQKMPVSSEEAARQFIASRPPVYCNVSDKEFLSRILPDFDLETENFFRWQVTLPQARLSELLKSKTGIDFGEITRIVPLARGASGRIYQLELCGTKAQHVFGKELEIRRILAPSHLYSSAFVVEPFGDQSGVPQGFTLIGAGWGHGVGLCQIGAAAMAHQGIGYRHILQHYFQGAQLCQVYD